MQDTKSNSMRNKVLGEHLIFFALFRRFSRLGIYEMVRCTGGRVLKDIPHLGIYKTFVLDRGRVLKGFLLIEGINTRGQKSMVFRLKRHVSGIKSPSEMICSGMQI